MFDGKRIDELTKLLIFGRLLDGCVGVFGWVWVLGRVGGGEGGGI